MCKGNYIDRVGEGRLNIEMTNFWLNPSDYGHPFGLTAG